MMLSILVLDIESKLQEEDLFGQDHLILPHAIPSPSLYILNMIIYIRSPVWP